METLERRDLLTVAAQLVSDFDFNNVGSRNSPISVIVGEDSTYQMVKQRDYFYIGRIDGNQRRGVEVGSAWGQKTQPPWKVLQL